MGDDTHAIARMFAETTMHLHMIKKCGCDCEDPYCLRCGPIKYPQIMDAMAPYWYGGVPRPTLAAAVVPGQWHPLTKRYTDYISPASPKNRLYELTLTLDPAQHPEKDPYYLITTFYKIVASKQYGILDWLYCIELQDNQYPHMHCLLVTSKLPVATNKLKQFFKYRYSFKLVKDINAYVAYIHKEEHNQQVNDYCRQYGTPQIRSKENNRQAQADAQTQNVQEKGKDLRNTADDLVFRTASATVATAVPDQTDH